jgi:hypothetical protein
MEVLSAASSLLQFAAVLNESKKKCREWQAKAQEAEERLENVRQCQSLHHSHTASHDAPWHSLEL